MSETKTPSRQLSFAGKVAGVVAFVVALVAVLYLLSGRRGSDDPLLTGGRGMLAAQFDRDVASGKPGMLVFQALKLHYPDDYAAFRRLYVQRRFANVSAAQFQAEAQAWMARFMTEHRGDLVRAPDLLLLSAVNGQLAAALALRSASPALCARYATTGFQPGDTPPPQVVPALTQANVARIAAMGEGHRAPARPEPTAMATADAQALARATMQRGATMADFEQISTPAGAAAMPPARACDLSIEMFQAVAAMPPAQAGRIAAVLFQDPAKLH